MSLKFLANGKEVDSIPLSYEDSFTLETVQDLIQSHAEDSKSFIIARVQSTDNGKAFYSYYNAFFLNKVLFQTQTYHGKRLIHRLHVLNPLTNTEITEDVQYFKVTGKKANKHQKKLSVNVEERTNNIMKKALPPPLVISMETAKMLGVPSPSSDPDSLPCSPAKSASKARKAHAKARSVAHKDAVFARSALLDVKQAASQGKQESKESEECQNAILIGTDNDYLESNTFRSIFKENALSLEDIYLFEMPEYPVMPSSAFQDDDEPFIVQLFSSRPRNLNSMSRNWRIFHNVKCYVLAIFLLISVMFLVVWSVMQAVPPNHNTNKT